jgi:hypothetical protein
MPKSNKLNIDLVNKNIDRYIENLKTLTTNKIFESQLKSTWNSNSNILNINNSDILPISKIKIVFKEPINKKQFKIILKNNNKFFQNQIIPIEVIDKHSIFLDVIIVADRVPVSNYNENSSRANIAENLLIRPTKFEFNFSNINKIPEIEKIYIENIIDNKFEEIKKSQKNAFNPSVHNYGITKLLENKNLILNGKIIVKKNTIFDSTVTILPGTQFLLYENVSMIFKNKVFFKGSQSNPITVSSVYKENKKPWGALAIVGQKTKGSTLSNVKITDGSGDNFENYQFTGMLSIHNSGDIKINNLNMENNHVYDDMVHFVYVDNIKIENTKLNNIYSDAIDIDSSSNIHISNLNISKSGNDCIDFMQTLAKIDNSSFSFCNDKGISVGERSKIIITNSVINSSKIGIESKDDSEVNIDSSKFYKNNIDMNAYKKNWRYGVGGRINYDKIDFDHKKVSTDKFSKIKEL